jgi:hypothetical protein
MGCGGVDEGIAVPAIIQGAYANSGTQLIITASQMTVINGDSSTFDGNICFEIEYRFVEVAASTTPAADAFDYHEFTLLRADDRKLIATIKFTFNEATLALTVPVDSGIDNTGGDHPNAIDGDDVIKLEFEFMTHMVPGYGAAADVVWTRL